MKEEVDVLIQFIKQEWDQSRQTENHRATTANWVLIMAMATIGYIVDYQIKNGSLQAELWPFTIALIIIGLYGLLASAKYYERYQFHIRRMQEWREQVNKMYPDAQLNDRKELAKKEHRKKYKIRSRIQLHWIVELLSLSIAVLGGVLTYLLRS